MVTRESVMKALKGCLDPEIGISVVDMGLIYGVDIGKDSVHVRMTLTNPGCPMSRMIVKDVEETVKGLDGIKKAEVELVWEPPWSPERMSEAAKLELGFY